MHREFCGAFTWPDSLGYASNIFNLDTALNALLVDVVNRIVCYSQGSLLRPVEHISLLYFVRIHQLV